MIILGWVTVILLAISVIAVLSKEKHQTFKDSFMSAIGMVLGFIAFFGTAGLLAFLFTGLITASFGEPDNTLKPTILSCNGVVVAESVNGFSYNSKSGTYQDYRNKLTYTPRQGEVCKEYLKEVK